MAMLSGAYAQAVAGTTPLTLSTFINGGSSSAGPATLLPRLSFFFPPGTVFGNGTVTMGQMLFRYLRALALPTYAVKRMLIMRA